MTLEAQRQTSVHRPVKAVKIRRLQGKAVSVPETV